MNNKALNFFKNFSYTLASNFITLLISSLIILIIPKFIGVEEYGYWQLYIFYSSYIGFLHFGWNDGIYLRYGGDLYKSLDKRLFNVQFYSLFVLQMLLLLILSSLFFRITENENTIYVLQSTFICMLLVNLRHMLLYILQATNKIKDFARVTILDRFLFALLLLILIMSNSVDFSKMITFDLITKLISLVYAIILCRDIVIRKISLKYCDLLETLENIKVGSRLMFSNIASNLVIGVVRFGIERNWGVGVFGKVSLTLSISGLLMVFINSVGIVLFPLLRRSSKDNLANIYTTSRDLLMILLLGMLIIYYPLKELLTIWLPEYSDAIIYLSILFPMLVYEGKMALLIKTYMKTLRLEKLLLKVNIFVLILSITTTVISTIILNNLNLAIFTIVFLIAIRCIISEILLAYNLNIFVLKDIFLELVLTSVFILMSWYLDTWYIVLYYANAIVVYYLIKYKNIKNALISLKKLIYKKGD